MLKEIIDALPKELYSQLMYAFEHDYSQYVVLPNNKFIGVNLTGKEPNLKILEKVGVWSQGDSYGEREI